MGFPFFGVFDETGVTKKSREGVFEARLKSLFLGETLLASVFTPIGYFDHLIFLSNTRR